MRHLALALSLTLGALCAPARAIAAPANTATDDVVLPAGYTIEPVVTGLTFPTSIEFAPDGSLYMAEAGYAYGQRWSEARVLKLRPDGRLFVIAGGFRAPIMGLTLRGDQLYVSHRGMVSVVDLAAADLRNRRRDIITGLPVVPNGGHFNSEVAFGPDGKMYVAVGVLTNSGVVGADEFLFGWLPDFPWMRDAPAREITLTGSNYPTPDVLGADIMRVLKTGAWVPFGAPTSPGQTIPAHRLPTGVVYRANPDGSDLQVYAWGIRSPFGLRFGPDGQLYMVNHEMDDRGGRPAAEAPDTLLQIREGAFYGWPDYVAGIPITDERFKPKFPLGKRPEFVMQNHPEVAQPLVRFEPHAAGMKFDWSRSERFGHRGELFLAEFGDGAPITTGLQNVAPRGFRVVRVNAGAGTWEPFMTINNAGTEQTRGPKHPIQALFDPSGDNLYLLDFGVMTVRVSLRQVGVTPLVRTGTVWRIRRSDGPAPSLPVTGMVVPVAGVVDGGRLISWCTARTTMLGIQKDLRLALEHARKGRIASGLVRGQHREEARSRIQSVRTQAAFVQKRVDERDIIDDGTRILLSRIVAWADDPLLEPLNLLPSEPIVTDIDRWIARTEFPEKEYLRQNYALPGRWQEPVENDIRW